MLVRLMKDLLRPRSAAADAAAPNGPLRLHVGGQTRHPAWKVLDVLPGPHVDYVAPCTNLSAFADGTVAEIYASHVLEHLGYQRELAGALHEFHRVLTPGGVLRISVPDLAALCSLFLDPALVTKERFHVMRMIFGGQVNDADFHKVGLYEEALRQFFEAAGFTDILRVESFGLFDDCSDLVFKGRRISLNLSARKPHAAPPASA